MIVKACRKCSATKPVAEFFRKRSSRDGLQSHCKLCSNRSRLASYHANRDSEREKFRAHYAANRAQYYARNDKRRALRQSAAHEPYDRTAIFAAYDNECVYCGAPAEHLDHVVPLSKGGADAAHNLLPACPPCNLSKSDKSLAEWALTWAPQR